MNAFNNFPYPFLAGPVGFGVGIVFALVVIWSLVWKGLALWKSARHGHKWWFIVLLIVNTLGILEILYIYIFSKKMRRNA
ncbi:MAG TPA: DUF5652 family protein [Candidatus Paceibacterota bacterium]|nr:DUF5652 family protein [Candidatus Paceibacterota bacterium]